MLVSELVDILQLVRTEYQRHEIQQLLTDAGNAVASRQPTNTSIYSNFANPTRQKAAQILANDVLSYLPRADRNFLESSDYGAFLPARIAKIVFEGLPTNQERSLTSNEFATYLDGVNRAISGIDAILRATAALKTERYQKKEDEIALRIELPRNLIENDLSKIANRFKYLDNIFAALTEARTGEANKPKLFTASTSDLITILTAHAPEIATIMTYYHDILEGVKQALEVKRGIDNAKSHGLTITKDDEERPSALLHAAINNSIDKIMAEPDMAAINTRKNELKKIVRNATIEMSADLPKGLKVSIHLVARSEFEYFAKFESVTNEELTKRIETDDALEAEIILLGRDSEPLLITTDTVGQNDSPTTSGAGTAPSSNSSSTTDTV